MQPAVERPDADTDVDSGRNYNTLVTYPVDALTFRPLTFCQGWALRSFPFRKLRSFAF